MAVVDGGGGSWEGELKVHKHRTAAVRKTTLRKEDTAAGGSNAEKLRTHCIQWNNCNGGGRLRSAVTVAKELDSFSLLYTSHPSPTHNLSPLSLKLMLQLLRSFFNNNYTASETVIFQGRKIFRKHQQTRELG